MAQTAALIHALKTALRRNGQRYTDVAEALNISESSVKRLFAEQSFSLKRIDQICSLIGIEITDLLTMMRDEQKIRQLTIEQEKELVADLSLLLVANSALNRWTFADILQRYCISETELIRHLAKLDRLGLIHLLPNNRIKVLVDRDFSWLQDGPINQFFEEQVRQEFFNSRFNKPGETRKFMIGMLTRESNAIIQRKLKKLSEDFHTLHREDEKLAPVDKFGTTLVVGMRLWEPEVFESKRREPDKRKF